MNTEHYYIGLDGLMSSHDQKYLSDAISDTIQENLCQEDETVGAFSYQVLVTYQKEVDDSND
jgi:hypothetical protein